MSEENKAADGPGYTGDPAVKQEAKRLDPDVAGHEASFDPDVEVATAKRAEADAQIAANAADHPQERGDAGPEKDQPEPSAQPEND